MRPVSSEGLNRETDEEVYFYTPLFQPLNNFSAHVVDLWGVSFPTAEHAFHWQKYCQVRSDIAEEILQAKSPLEAKEIAIKNKDSRSPGWPDQKLAVMEEILRAKFEQHPEVSATLQRTGKRKIIENSPSDSFWGIGSNKDGENNLGKIWMKIRDSQ